MFKPTLNKHWDQKLRTGNKYWYHLRLNGTDPGHMILTTEECAKQLQQYIDKVHPTEKDDLTGAGDMGDHWV